MRRSSQSTTHGHSRPDRACARRGPSRSLLVVLDDVGPPRRGVVGVEPELLPSPALAQQVPAAVELDLQRAQPFPIPLEGLYVSAVLLLAATQVLLLGDQPLDFGRQCSRR